MTHYLGASRSLTVNGDARERARQQGLACAGEYRRAASSIGSLVVEPRHVGQRVHERLSQAGLLAAGAAYLVRHRPALVDHQRGKYWRAFEGLAEGAGLTLPLMFGLGAVPEIVGAQMGYTLGCTAIAVAAEASEDGGAQIAYNHDFPPRFGRYNFVRRNHPSDGYRSVSLSYPIMVGSLAGVNERGLALTLNHAFATDFDSKPGLLLTTLVQDCLDRCADVGEALELFRTAPVTNGAILTFADAGGQRAVLERSCSLARTRSAEGPLLVSFNKYQHPDMSRVEVPLGAVSSGLIAGIPLHESNLARAARFKALEDALPERMSAQALRQLMSDHGGDKGSANTICRHDDPLSETLWSAVLSTEQKSLRVAFGHACSGAPREYGIESGSASLTPASRPQQQRRPD